MDDLKDEFPHLPERIVDLWKLAYNFWWSWHPAARMLFKRLDRLAWKATGHNPVKLLKVLPQKSLDAAASDPEYLGPYDAVLTEFRREMQPQVCWFTENITATENSHLQPGLVGLEPLATLPSRYWEVVNNCYPQKLIKLMKMLPI
ncbi:MAG: DUF3417 domain-containing protein [Desulfobaccales bacterium]